VNQSEAAKLRNGGEKENGWNTHLKLFACYVNLSELYLGVKIVCDDSFVETIFLRHLFIQYINFKVKKKTDGTHT